MYSTVNRIFAFWMIRCYVDFSPCCSNALQPSLPIFQHTLVQMILQGKIKGLNFCQTAVHWKMIKKNLHIHQEWLFACIFKSLCICVLSMGMFVCTCVRLHTWTCTYVHINVHRSQKGVFYSLELELQVSVSHQHWVLGNKPQFSVKAARQTTEPSAQPCCQSCYHCCKALKCLKS